MKRRRGFHNTVLTTRPLLYLWSSCSTHQQEDNAGGGEREGAVGYGDIFRHFALLGWTAFGGPAAHLGMFEKLFVERLHWMTCAPTMMFIFQSIVLVGAFFPHKIQSDPTPPHLSKSNRHASHLHSRHRSKSNRSRAALLQKSSAIHMELVALGGCLPGPTSTQVSFAIGVIKKGIPGGLLSGMLFQYPGLLLMSLAGVGAASVLLDPVPWLACASAGLSAAGVGLVVAALRGLVSKIATTLDTQLICALAAIAAFYFHAWWLFVAVLLAGAAASLVINRARDMAMAPSGDHIEARRLSFSACIVRAAPA